MDVAGHEAEPLLKTHAPRQPAPRWRHYARRSLLAVLLGAGALALVVATNTRANAAFRAYASLGAKDGQCMIDLFATWVETEQYMATSMAAGDMDAAKVTATFEGVSFPDFEAHFVHFDEPPRPRGRGRGNRRRRRRRRRRRSRRGRRDGTDDKQLTFYGADQTPYSDNEWHTLQGPTAVADLVAVFAQLKQLTGVQLVEEVAYGVDHIGVVGHTQGLAPSASHSMCSNVDEADVLLGKVLLVEIAYEYKMHVEEGDEDQVWRIVVTAYDASDAGTCKVRCFIVQIYDVAA